ncbi:MAG: HD domain-containing protein [Coriobacteriia bacterium]
MNRDEAFALVVQRIDNRNLVNHCVAVEIIMEGLARHFALPESDVARWGLAGLLHDLDYAETAHDFDRHGVETARELEGVVDAEILHAILAHADKAPRETQMDRALFAADPTTGFIVAAALVRPEKTLEAVKVSSLVKRWKEKAFAKGASREQMDACAELGLSRPEFLELALASMQERATEIGL